MSTPNRTSTGALTPAQKLAAGASLTRDERLLYHRQLEYLRATGAQYRKRIGKGKAKTRGRARTPGKVSRWRRERSRKLDEVTGRREVQ